MPTVFVYLTLINSIAFLANGTDKWLAVRNRWRIPEKTLLGMVLVGGTVGSGIGMLLFRHKTAKKSYLMFFFGIVALQLMGLYFYFKEA
ncbi:DUF1294 domain-containing protein [Flavobacterium pedocola]